MNLEDVNNDNEKAKFSTFEKLKCKKLMSDLL
jgi:hypothetical protein